MSTIDAIFRDLDIVLKRTFADRDFPDAVEAGTLVFADLGLASIEVVVLAEKLEQHFGRKLAFGPFLAGLRIRGAKDIEVGELVAYLKEQLAAS